MEDVRKEYQMAFQRTGDPVSDAGHYYDELDSRLERMPECENCGDHITTEYLYVVDGKVYCEDCMNDFRKDTMDYVEDDNF